MEKQKGSFAERGKAETFKKEYAISYPYYFL
jgi:hypothetical protein